MYWVGQRRPDNFYQQKRGIRKTLSGNKLNSNIDSTHVHRQLTTEYPAFPGLPSARLLDCRTGQTALWVFLLGFSYPDPEQNCVPGPGYYCSPTMALPFTLPRSTSPIFSDMSQESGITSTSSNLENQLADAMTVIQTLMANIGNLTQQVIHLTQNVALMQANQNFPPRASISQPSPHNFPLPPSPQYQPLPPPSWLELAQDQAAPMPFSSCIREPKIATPLPISGKSVTWHYDRV